MPHHSLLPALPCRERPMKIFNFKLSFWFLMFGCVVSGCGGDSVNEGEDYGNLLNTSGGLTLNQSKHELGWGNSQCTLCHNLENIHLVNRTGTATDIVA